VGIDPLKFKPIEFALCDINSYYKTVMLVLFNCALIDIMLEFGLDNAWLIGFVIQ
jgi:hypothetical protein